MGPKQENHLIFPDLLKIMGVFAVILLHFSIYQLMSHPKHSLWWENSIFYSAYFSFFVPIFFMVSGMFLLDPRKKESNKLFFTKRWKKVGFPFLVWTTIYYFQETKIALSEFSWFPFAKTLLAGPVKYHLWFLYALIGIYLATPIIRIFIAHARKEIIEYFLIIWFGIFCLLPIYYRIWEISIGLDATIFRSFLGYFILGYYLNTKQIKPSLKTYLTTAFLFIITGFIAFKATWLASEKHVFFDNFWVLYHSPLLVIMASCLFILFKVSEPWFKRTLINQIDIIKKISSLTLGIYLIHVIISETFLERLLYITPTHTSYLFAALQIFTLCALCVSFLKMIPIVKYIVP